MSQFVYIPYTGQAELEKMISLVNSRPAERITDFPSLVDLQEMLGVTEIQANTGLWQDRDGRLAGFAILDETQLIFELAPSRAQDDLGQEIIRWGMQRVHECSGVSAPSMGLETSCRDDDAPRCSLLEGAGFQRLPWGTVLLARSLAEPIPAAQPPPGFTIRPLAGESEASAWVALHRLAWGTENMTLEYRLSMMRIPSYDPDLDLVAVAPDDSLAAYSVCYISPEENALSGRKVGYTDPIATHPEYQRLGLAKALLLTGLDLLRQRGMHTACLGTSSENIAMQCAARSVGFQLEHTWLRYSLHPLVPEGPGA
jgi:ribosomal protein S18 acetylase RimI-like enzyme